MWSALDPIPSRTAYLIACMSSLAVSNCNLYFHCRDSGILNMTVPKVPKSCTDCHFNTEKQISQFHGKFSQRAWCLIDKTIYQRIELSLYVSRISFGSIQAGRQREKRFGEKRTLSLTQ